MKFIHVLHNPSLFFFLSRNEIPQHIKTHQHPLLILWIIHAQQWRFSNLTPSNLKPSGSSHKLHAFNKTENERRKNKSKRIGSGANTRSFPLFFFISSDLETEVAVLRLIHLFSFFRNLHCRSRLCVWFLVKTGFWSEKRRRRGVGFHKKFQKRTKNCSDAVALRPTTTSEHLRPPLFFPSLSNAPGERRELLSLLSYLCHV